MPLSALELAKPELGVGGEGARSAPVRLGVAARFLPPTTVLLRDEGAGAGDVGRSLPR